MAIIASERSFTLCKSLTRLLSTRWLRTLLGAHLPGQQTIFDSDCKTWSQQRALREQDCDELVHCAQHCSKRGEAAFGLLAILDELLGTESMVIEPENYISSHLCLLDLGAYLCITATLLQTDM